MNAVKDDVIQLVAKELASANEQFPLFASSTRDMQLCMRRWKSAPSS